MEEYFYNKYHDYNTQVLKLMAETMMKFNGLRPKEAHQLAQQLKTGNSIEEIIKQLQRLTNKSRKEIIEVLEQTAKDNINFAEVYYKYRGIETSYETNKEFQSIVKSVAKLTDEAMINLSKTTAIRFKKANGDFILKDLRQAYYEVIDRSVLAVATGQEDFQSMYRRTIKELKNSGIRKVYYNNEGKVEYTRRLDSSVRMNILDAIRQVNQGIEEQIKDEIDADGIEISHHINSAFDHVKVEGRQYTIEEYEKLNSELKRPIGTLNCYHRIWYVILGVERPQYTEEQLKKDQNNNEKGFEFEDKHYTMYQGTQLQRQIESEIRKAKDEQILARQGNMDDVNMQNQVLNAQKRIRILTSKYNKICSVSGLPNRLKDRASVNGYRQIKVK